MRSFDRDLASSMGPAQVRRDKLALMEAFGHSCNGIKKGSREDERKGIDYWVRLRGGAVFSVDAKHRDVGRYTKDWRSKDDPDLTLEVYSVVPSRGDPSTGKAGWTLDESKLTDYVLWTWPRDQFNGFVVTPFQLLRKAFRANHATWSGQFKCHRSTTTNRSGLEWHSDCVYVPASVVWEAIRAAAGSAQPMPVGGVVPQRRLFA